MSYLVLVLVLVGINGLFVAAEFAMVKVRGSRIETLVQTGSRRAKFGKIVISNLDAYLSACQLGITLASLALGWAGEPAVVAIVKPLMLSFGFSEEMVHRVSFFLAFALITALHIILGELAPKSIAIQRSDAVTLWLAVPLIGFYKVMYPFIWLLNTLANLFLKMLGVEAIGEQEAAHTEEEIRILMAESHRQGYIDQTELTYVDNIFAFSERTAKEIMIPRTDMICLYAEDSCEESIKKALSEQLTRYPLCDPDKDHIIGFVHIKDLLEMVVNGQVCNIRGLAREITAIPSSMAISELLKLLQRNKAQIALVVDEYGGTAGLVTVEDILEEIVGEIQDEFDEERPLIEELSEQSYSVDGRLLLAEASEILQIVFEAEEVDTIGGWLYSQLRDRIAVGARFIYQGYEFVIEAGDPVRIYRVQISPVNEL
ncbi:MAG: hemolysin family protein [Sporomusaceae bacterium]|nr:hemolysin family protein [Sporomusaceae bacterium]